LTALQTLDPLTLDDERGCDCMSARRVHNARNAALAKHC
jgi:hypothetical protein